MTDGPTATLRATVWWKDGTAGDGVSGRYRSVDCTVLTLRSRDSSLIEAAKREGSPVADALERYIYVNDLTVTAARLELDDSGDVIPVDVDLRVSLWVENLQLKPLWLVCKARGETRPVIEVQNIQYPRVRELLFAICHARLIEDDVGRGCRSAIDASGPYYRSRLRQLWETTNEGKATTSKLLSSPVSEAVEAAIGSLDTEDFGRFAAGQETKLTSSQLAIFDRDIATVRRLAARALALKDHVPTCAASGDLSELTYKLSLLASISHALVDLLDHESCQPPNPKGGSDDPEDRGDCDPPSLTPGLAYTSDFNIANTLDRFHRAARKHTTNNLVFGSLMEEAITSIVRSWLPPEVRVSSGSVKGLISTPQAKERHNATASDSEEGNAADPQDFEVDLVFWTPTRAHAVVEAGGVAVVPPDAVLGLMEIKAGKRIWTSGGVKSLAARMRWLRHRLTCLQFDARPTRPIGEPVARVPVLGVIIEVADDLYDLRMEHHRLVTALVDKPSDVPDRWVRPGVISDLRYFVRHDVLEANGFAAQTEPLGRARGR